MIRKIIKAPFLFLFAVLWITWLVIKGKGSFRFVFQELQKQCMRGEIETEMAKANEAIGEVARRKKARWN